MTERITDEELAAAEARCEAATPEPWFVERCEGIYAPFYEYAIPMILRDRYGDNSLHCGSDKATAEFIAAARTDVPRLIAALRAERADLRIANEATVVLLARCAAAESDIDRLFGRDAELGWALADQASQTVRARLALDDRANFRVDL